MINKFGPHHQTGGNSYTARWLREARPTVAKFVGDFGVADLAGSMTLCIGRQVDDGWLNGQGFDVNRYASNGDSPLTLARQYVDWLMPHISRNPRIDVWEGPNEQHPFGSVEMHWYSTFLREFARILDTIGKRGGLGSWSEGTPDYTLWSDYEPVLAACRLYRAVLTRHEYGPLDGDHCLRYRKDNAIFTGMGYPGVPLVITECGADAVAGQTPWKGSYWGGNVDRYWDELLRPYLIEISKDPYVLGATIYTVNGSTDDQFNILDSGVLERIEIEMNVDTLIADWSMYQSRYHGDGTWASKYNPNDWTVDIDWAALEQAPISAIGLRIGIGVTKDPCFDRYLTGVLASPRFHDSWFIYHVPIPDHIDAQPDLIRYWCPRQPPLGVAGDLEIDGLTFAMVNPYLVEIDHLFARLTEIYSGGPFMDTHFSLAEQLVWVGRPTWWAGYPHFITPAGWVGRAINYSKHQFTDAYTYPGPARPTDMSRLNPVLSLDDLRVVPIAKEDNVSLLLSLTGLSHETVLNVEKHMQDLYADVQATGAVLPYNPPPLPAPVPEPTLPYVARVLYGLRVRRNTGADTGEILAAGTPVIVWSDPTTIAGWQDRVVIRENGDNIWTGNGDPRGPSLKQL